MLQVVWDDSTMFGMGRANKIEGDMTCTYVVGRYRKAGNIMGQFTKNVHKGNYKDPLLECCFS